MFELKEKLEQLGQSQLLNFYDELTSIEQEQLLNDINSIDIKKMNELYEKSFTDEVFDINKVTPLKCVIADELAEKEDYVKLAKDFVKKQKYAVVIMAGGNGSRLGLDIPKGCLELNVKDKKISLFESYINQLKNVYNELNIYINLYLMTSFSNYDQTINYFIENNYFDYPKDKIHFFIQDKLPILDKNGKILLSDKSHILYGPNGNGNVFKALKKYNLINHMKDNGIEKVLFVTVDNALLKLIDYEFIGCSLIKNSKLTTKTIFKEDKEKKDWIFCSYNNKPSMLPYTYQSEEIKSKKDKDGNYLYRETNITYHLIDISEIIKYSNIDLKYHRAYKMNKYINLEGEIINPTEPNTFKFEQFIFDAFAYSDDMLLYRINKDEFCPIKTQDDIKYVSSILSDRE